ncbi:hypothetical protein DY138_01445 [Apilactobacillus timberlakei]|uniref:hypothetical protein n=1 Tax=Apilactobacillus timberlakei TaxID=2008380 RepID=UPI001128E903|nr:hypothetical protein [Apilactobacillus timberlakei]TPR20132.1 hypothetical protein DY138_01445 [Apilactobacillus timberlakei]TPR20445.1 hypothetical protein DY083_08270 [Apilactobacillus timberlakei]TPR21850.1 hypothetical protein DY061_01360 [Apilactobacillus timberlakei]
MKNIAFKGFQFYYDYKQSRYLINEDSLTFFASDTEVRIHISIVEGKLLLRPRYGVTIKKLADKSYKILANE